MKTIGKILIFIIVIVLLLVALRNTIAFNLLSNLLYNKTSLRAKVDKFNIGINPPSVEIENLLLMNPRSFPDTVMASVPYISIQYEPVSIFKKSPHIRLLQIYIKEFNVVKIDTEEINVKYLKISRNQEPEKQKRKKIEYLVDALELKVDKVSIKDYSSNAQGEIREFVVNIDERYEDIDNFKSLLKIIMVKSLAKTTISDITSLNLPALKQDVDGVLKGGVSLFGKAFGKITDTTKGVINKTSDIVKYPFDKKADNLEGGGSE